MTRIYLIRHAQADGNLYRRCQAWYDGLITPVGAQQIAALRQRFIDTRFDAVYSSDLYRTMTTAKAISEPRKLTIYTDPELREIKSGDWEDRPWGELLQRDRQSLLAFWRCDPEWKIEGGETFPEIQTRFDRALKRIAANHPDQTIAVFAHGCIIRASLAHWLKVPEIREIPHGDNTSVAYLEYEHDSIHVQWYNDTSHLSGELARAPHPAAKTDKATAAGIEQGSLYFCPAESLSLNECDLAPYFKTAEPYSTSGSFQGRENQHLFTAMLNGETVGSLLVDTSDLNAGHITFLYLSPQFRRRRLGVQLIGQAVSICRNLGYQYLRIRCPQTCPEIIHFLLKYGFDPVDSPFIYEKYIGY